MRDASTDRAAWPDFPAQSASTDALREWRYALLEALALQPADAEVLLTAEPGGAVRFEIREGQSPVVSTTLALKSSYPWLVAFFKKMARLDVAEKRVVQRGEIKLATGPERAVAGRTIFIETRPGNPSESVLLKNHRPWNP
jgi:hypothetical protein